MCAMLGGKLGLFAPILYIRARAQIITVNSGNCNDSSISISATRNTKHDDFSVKNVENNLELWSKVCTFVALKSYIV